MNYKWRNHTILIVEDDIFSAKLLKYYLSKTEIKIICVRNGLQAIELCINHKDIDIVIMDIELPILNGIDATIEIKKIRKELPIIALTGIISFREKCLNAGCVDFISKPTTENALLNKLSKYLNLKSPSYSHLKIDFKVK
jgi:CheY-like chemotaxis protein